LHDLLRWFQQHPSPMEETTRTFAEMVTTLKALPRRDAERLMDMGDGNVLMPITLFEHFIYPTAYLRAYLEELPVAKQAGGIECAFIYSFFMQHQALPHDRTEDEIALLRATALASDEAIPHQINNSSDTVTGLSMAMANTLDKLEDECAMPTDLQDSTILVSRTSRGTCSCHQDDHRPLPRAGHKRLPHATHC
jgi:hypothetical protein